MSSLEQVALSDLIAELERRAISIVLGITYTEDDKDKQLDIVHGRENSVISMTHKLVMKAEYEYRESLKTESQ